MKKLINDPRYIVAEMVEGLLVAYPGLSRLQDHNVLLRTDFHAARDGQAALISGGGSGHEPAHAGYVGAGMLSAAVAGDVFTSPSPDAVLAAIRTVAGAPGVLLIVKNYTGDRLNFGMAAEAARAEGIVVETVLVADDVALARTEGQAGRRGLAGTVLVHKIAGAAAAEGKTLREVAEIARAVANDAATMGVSLSAGTIPGATGPSFTLGEGEMEFGLGIHGEPGVRRGSLQPVDAVVDSMLQAIWDARPMAGGTPCTLLINNLGATTNMELALVARQADSALRSRGIDVRRVYSGAFMTSLNMAGVSLTLLPVDDARLRWLDAPTSAPAWPDSSAAWTGNAQSRIVPSPVRAQEPARTTVEETAASRRALSAIESCCHALLAAEGQLTELDRAAGDGDLGTTMTRGANALLDALPTLPLHSAPVLLGAIGQILQRTLGGSSGPLYGVAFLRAANSLRHRQLDAKAWADAIAEACAALSELGGAEAGDKTMLDALLPFSAAFQQQVQHGASADKALQLAVSAAEGGAEATAGMMPKRGRASYLGERALGARDGGAVAVAFWLRALARDIES